MLILRFRLTIRNVNLLKSYILVLKATGFRLTIRNVNWIKENLCIVEYEGFRLTIRNVNWGRDIFFCSCSNMF